MRKIFAILGKASVGKDSLTNMLSEEIGMPIATSFTTRPMRAMEEQGREYNFISKQKFNWYRDVNWLAEYTQYTVASGETWYYGLTTKELEKDEYVLVIVNPHGLKQLKEIYGDKICSILIDADPKTRIDRYLDRDVTDELKAEECCRRFLADNKDFEEFKADFKIQNNGEVLLAFSEMLRVVKNEISKDMLNKTNEDFKDNPARFICN